MVAASDPPSVPTEPTEPTGVQLEALTHATRQQLWAQLAHGPSTVSQLARRLAVNKGNVAHHLAVLERVGLVVRGPRRTVRGGTEQHFERAVHHLRAARPSAARRAATDTAVQTVRRELGEDPSARLHVRHLRLTARQADAVAAHLDAVLETLEQAPPTEVEYGLVVGVWRRPLR